jgi:UDP-glucose 4-epimerase
VCCLQLLKAGHSVQVVDDLSGGHRDSVPNGAKLHAFRIDDPERLGPLLEREHFDSVFHFAGKIQVGESMRDPGLYFRENVAAGIMLLEMLRAARVKNFVFSSTAAVYGIPRSPTIPEDAAKNPINAYGETKLMFERVLEWYAQAYSWSVTALRYFNASGAAEGCGERHDPETHIIPLLLETALGKRGSFQIYGTDYPTPDGTCLRDYVHVLDIADAHILAEKHFGQAGFRAYNIGTGQAHSVREVWQAAEKVAGRKINVETSARREGDPAVLCADPSKLQRELGWTPKHSRLENIVGSAWEFARGQ